MRPILFVVLVSACGSSASPVNNHAPPPSTSVRTAVDDAALIVVGQAVSIAGAATDGIDIDRVLAGAGEYGVTLEAHANLVDGAPDIYYLVPSSTADRWRLLPAPTPPLDEAAIVTAIAHRPSQPAPPALAPALATFRSGHAAPWSPAQEPAIHAAVEILRGWVMIGSDEATIRAALGPPDSTDGDRWLYMRHNGESGAGFNLRFTAGRVSAVDIVRTQ